MSDSENNQSLNHEKKQNKDARKKFCMNESAKH